MSTNISLRQPERKEFDLLPEDTYEVIIEGLKDRERDVFEEQGKKETVIAFTFRIIEDGPYNGRKLWKDAHPVLWPGEVFGNPSTLYQIYSVATGKKLTQAECEAMEDISAINALEGMPLRVVVTQKKSRAGKLGNRIVSFLPSKENQYADEPTTENGEDAPLPENPL